MKLTNPSRALIFLIALLVPVLAAGAFSATLAHPQQHAHDVVAAVVNNDEPVEIDGQLVPLGRQLAAALVEGQGLAGTEEGSQNYTWVMTNEELAEEGLRAGTYTALVRIPPEFSAAATSTADPSGPIDQALIEVTTTERGRLADEAMTNTIVRAAMASLSQELASTYLDNVFVGFNTLGTELGEAAEGARSLAQGASELTDGVGELADATGQVSEGAGTLATGSSDLAGGADELASGASLLANGTRDLASGTGELAGGLDELAGGLNEYAHGTDDFASGISDLKTGTADLAGGAEELAGGAQTLAEGSQELAGGADELTYGLGELTDGAEQLAGGLAELQGAIGDAPAELEGLEDLLAGGADEIREMANEVANAAPSIENIIAEVCAADPEGEACRVISEYLSDSEALQTLLDQISSGMHQVADGLDNAGGTEGFLGQIQQLFGAIEEMSDGANELSDGLGQVHLGAGELSDGANDLAQGNADLAAGLAELAGGADLLDTGVGELHGGAGELSDGAHTLAQAGNEVAGGAGTLATGARDLSTGTGELSTGAQDLATGAGTLADGAGELAFGLGELATGTEELAEGAGEFREGASALADGLGEATDEIPSYPDGQRETLAEAIADPIGIDGEAPANFRWLAFFGVLALWLGGLWLLAAYPAVAKNAGSSTRSAAALTWGAMKIPAVVALLQGAAVGLLIGIIAQASAAGVVGFTVLAILMSLTFTAVQRGLVALLGWGGVALTVLIGVFAIATGLLTAMPQAATTVLGWLPIWPGIAATQGLEIAGGAAAGPILGLLAWGGAGVLAILAATRRAQTRID